MYRIEFNGRLLDGFDPQFVRLEVGVRLRLREAQLERLFSGQTVVLKKAVSEANSKAYIDELRTLGLDAVLVPLDTPEPQKSAGADYKVVYWGKILPGFERASVMANTTKRFRVAPAQLKQMFSGAKVVLKRGVTAEQGARLVVDMALIGLQIELEVDAPSETIALQPTPPGVPMLPCAAQQEDDAQYAALLRTACDLSGTPFSGYDASSSVARDDDEPPPPPPKPAGGGFSSANTDGYLNCPRCGFYQAYAITCSKCGVELPKPRVYVGRVDRFADIAPTTVVNPGEPLQAEVAASAAPKKSAESLQDLMRLQGGRADDESRRKFPWSKVIMAALGLAGVAYFALR